VPAFVSQPCFEVKQAHFREPRFQSRNVSLKPSFVEPTKHLVEFLAEHHAEKRQRNFLEFDALSQDAAEHFRRLSIGEIASGDLQLKADEILWSIERQRPKATDVINRDRLIRFVAANRRPITMSP
jgi:hypothetical protein